MVSLSSPLASRLWGGCGTPYPTRTPVASALGCHRARSTGHTRARAADINVLFASFWDPKLEDGSGTQFYLLEMGPGTGMWSFESGARPSPLCCCCFKPLSLCSLLPAPPPLQNVIQLLAHTGRVMISLSVTKPWPVLDRAQG